METRVQHILETRFSVRLRAHRLTLEWLEERLELLRRFTLPSVAAQTTEAFDWLLLCDVSTHPEILAQLREEARRVPALRIELTSDERPPLAVIRSAVHPDAGVLITTRLDSDDAIADRYLEAVHQYTKSFMHSDSENLVVNFPRGYRLDRVARRLYAGWMPNSPFHSFFERPGHAPVATVMGQSPKLKELYATYRYLSSLGLESSGHARRHQHFLTCQDESIAAWMIVVHGGNLVNRIPTTARKLPVGTEPAGFTVGERFTD